MMDILDDFFPEDDDRTVTFDPYEVTEIPATKTITLEAKKMGKQFMKITTKGEVLIELMEEFSEGHTAPQEEAYSKAKTLLEEFQEIMGSGIFDALKEVADLGPYEIVQEILAWDKKRNQALNLLTENHQPEIVIIKIYDQMTNDRVLGFDRGKTPTFVYHYKVSYAGKTKESWLQTEHLWSLDDLKELIISRLDK